MTDKDKTPTLVKLPAAKSKLEVAAEDMRRNLPYYIEQQQQLAKIRRAAYAAYIDEGFTAIEALELCKVL